MAKNNLSSGGQSQTGETIKVGYLDIMQSHNDPIPPAGWKTVKQIHAGGITHLSYARTMQIFQRARESGKINAMRYRGSWYYPPN